MKKIIGICAAALVLILALLYINPPEKLSAFLGKEAEPLYSLTGDGEKFYFEDADYAQEKYNAQECCAEAERLLNVPFKVIKREEPAGGLDVSRYELKSKKLPFTVNVYSSYEVLELEAYGGSGVLLVAHAHCDYYERCMDYVQAEADSLAAEYGLEVERSGETARVHVSGYDELEQVYEYLNATNELYDFAMNEAYMSNILYDIRNRPQLIPTVSTPEGEEDVITLYYTINHQLYPYVKNALLPAMQEAYIETLDRLGQEDSAVTKEVRRERVKPALTQLCINGEPVQAKECDGFTLDPNIVFTYDWLLQGYYGDVRLCFPAADYDVPPDELGDDRNFKYLVELLGGKYVSQKDDSLLDNYYKADWWLGGNEYGAGTFTQSYIPTMSAFSVNDVGISIENYFSKEMWGLEDGYSTSDFFLRIPPESLAKLLGVEAEADFDNGTLNLITPEGYFDYSLPEESTEVFSERFTVEKIMSENGLAVKNNRYIIYNKNGSVLEDRTTEDYVWAYLTQVTENIVAVRLSGVGSVDNMTFYDTDSGAVSKVYNNAVLLRWPYAAYSPQYSGEVVLVNLETGKEVTVVTDAYKTVNCLRSATLSSDGMSLKIVCTKPDGEYAADITETVSITLP